VSSGARRLAVPPIDGDVTGAELDTDVKRELATLRSASAGTVARHLVMAGRLLDTDPEVAWLHAAEARRLAGRVAVVREAAGVAAYTAGHYGEARTEFRAARRLNGSAAYLPVLADCERGLGRPERALELLDDPDVGRLEPTDRVELLIVAGGALRDLGRVDEALRLLAQRELEASPPGPGTVRLRYAYADALAAAGRPEDALSWFTRAAEIDHDDETDAAERVALLQGVPFDEGSGASPEPAP
jgi:tetratricopeptide (TPR) repeat protein